LISDDLDEILGVADRVAVIHARRLSDARPAAAWTRAQIGLAMTGTAAESEAVG
jgi:simple sugar transport system ATP-binding protein